MKVCKPIKQLQLNCLCRSLLKSKLKENCQNNESSSKIKSNNNILLLTYTDVGLRQTLGRVRAATYWKLEVPENWVKGIKTTAAIYGVVL